MLIIIVDKTLIKKKPFITSNIPNFIEKLLIILAKIKLLIHFATSASRASGGLAVAANSGRLSSRAAGVPVSA
jgi:hypothetical protein